MLTYSVELKPQKDGGYTAIVPALPGCISEGDTMEDVLNNIKDAIEGYIKTAVKHKNRIPLELSEFKKIEVFKSSPKRKTVSSN